MITLITAIPGSGKTLWVLKHLHEFSLKENRQVYYSGINLTEKGKEILGWEELEDPLLWYELPPMAIIVMDEAQRIFRPRPSGSKVPKHVEMLETHRHLGVDLYLITQRPNQLDIACRQLAGRHYHLKRPFGMKYATVSRWDECMDNFTKSALKESLQDRFYYPREVFTWYKSAEAHTHKLDLPWKKLGLFCGAALALIVFLSLLYAQFNKWMGGGSPELPGAAVPAASSRGVPGQFAAAGTSQLNYFDSRIPRITGLPHTAPVFDGITAPTQAPKPAACIANQDRCVCYTQQGTRMAMTPIDLCRDIAENGWFDESAPIQANGPASPSAATSALPAPTPG